MDKNSDRWKEFDSTGNPWVKCGIIAVEIAPRVDSGDLSNFFKERDYGNFVESVIKLRDCRVANWGSAYGLIVLPILPEFEESDLAKFVDVAMAVYRCVDGYNIEPRNELSAMSEELGATEPAVRVQPVRVSLVCHLGEVRKQPANPQNIEGQPVQYVNEHFNALRQPRGIALTEALCKSLGKTIDSDPILRLFTRETRKLPRNRMAEVRVFDHPVAPARCGWFSGFLREYKRLVHPKDVNDGEGSDLWYVLIHTGAYELTEKFLHDLFQGEDRPDLSEVELYSLLGSAELLLTFREGQRLKVLKFVDKIDKGIRPFLGPHARKDLRVFNVTNEHYREEKARNNDSAYSGESYWTFKQGRLFSDPLDWQQWHCVRGFVVLSYNDRGDMEEALLTLVENCLNNHPSIVDRYSRAGGTLLEPLTKDETRIVKGTPKDRRYIGYAEDEVVIVEFLLRCSEFQELNRLSKDLENVIKRVGDRDDILSKETFLAYKYDRLNPTPGPTAEGDLVFVSYSHQDKDLCDELMEHLVPAGRSGSIKAWSDEQIKPGSRWYPEIKAAIARAKVGVLLVSRHFHASEFIQNEELKPLLQNTKVRWVPLGASDYEETELKDIQAAHPPKKPLNTLTPAERDIAWVEIVQEIKKALTDGNIS